MVKKQAGARAEPGERQRPFLGEPTVAQQVVACMVWSWCPDPMAPGWPLMCTACRSREAFQWDWFLDCT